jgi:hypothetical protein
MKPEQQQRVNLIVSMGMEVQADAGDFAAIETAAHAQSVITPNGRRFTGKETMLALMAAGHEVSPIIAKMRSDALASEMMNMLPNGGVDWADASSQVILASLIEPGSPITQAVIDTLTDMAVDVSSPAQGAGVPADTVALDFQIAWITHTGLGVTTDAMTAANATRDTSIAAAQVPLDAAQVTYATAKTDAQAISQPVSSKHNAVNAWLQVFEGTTAAEWQTEVDELLASPDGNGSHGA